MRTVIVDPRDITWEDEEPVFRVYFWKKTWESEHPDEPDTYESIEWEVSEADVKEVISWADAYARREGIDMYTFYLRASDARGRPGLIKLFGVDPTE
ncbi:hypothetical protein ACH4FX_42005 [Streptomyces sp. NPDC018019]|uniref:hypothetical protein n=1 Tax=Streptomyces sp. NPDC018019 TaxID=3365030 RepID=UPI0037B2CBA9